jgi:phosphonate transport system substrate-binding protein
MKLPTSATRRRVLVTGLSAAVGSFALPALARSANADATLRLGVGMFQPDRESNDATYRPLADHLAERLGRPVALRTVDSWEGLAKSLASGETDIALMGPWGYVLAHHHAGARAVATIVYDGRPEYHAIIVTHPDSGLRSVHDLLGGAGRGRSFAFGDKGSTSGYLIPLHFFMRQGIDPESHFGRVLYTRHQAIETQVAAGRLDAGADYDRNRNAMIEQGLIRPDRSLIIWTSDPLPNDAVAVRADLAKDAAFVAKLRAALASVGPELRRTPNLLPPRYTGFVDKENSFYRPIRDAGLATGKLATQ